VTKYCWPESDIINFIILLIDEDSALTNGFTKKVEVHLQRLSKKSITSARAPIKNERKKLKVKKVNKCPICPAQFVWRPPLMEHIKDKHPELTICAFCDTVFTKASDFKTHSMDCKMPEGNVQCAKCNLLCKSEKRLAVHDMMKHQPVTCTICKKSVGNKLSLSIHQKKCGIKKVD
jgi:hypothetical protein